MKFKDYLIINPPLNPDGTRNRGSSAKDAFWCGYDGGPKRGEKGSHTRRAWEAGKFYRNNRK